MKKFNLFALMAIALVALSSCSVVTGIFKAGFWVGVIIVVAIVALVLYFANKSKD